MKRLFSLCFAIVFLMCFIAGCSSESQNGNSSYAVSQSTDTYEIMHVVKKSEDFFVGRINPDGELTEYGIFQNKGNNSFELIVNIGYGDTPHIYTYKNSIYYLKSNQLYSFEINNPMKQNSLMPESMKDNNAGYVLKSFISIDDKWITLEADKWGVNENNDAVHIPTKIAISLNGQQWKEFSDEQ